MKRLRDRMVEQVAILVGVCIALRLVLWIIEPVLPLVGGLFVLAAIAAWVFGRNGSGGYR